MDKTQILSREQAEVGLAFMRNKLGPLPERKPVIPRQREELELTEFLAILMRPAVARARKAAQEAFEPAEAEWKPAFEQAFTILFNEIQ